MSQFNLIDDYLTNRLNGESKRLFEEEMKVDNLLKEEVQFQKSVIEGIRKARITELKAMLNNVPVGGASALSGKLALAAFSVGILATLVYYLGFNTNNNTSVETPVQTQEIVTEESTLPIDTRKKETASGISAESLVPEKVNEASSTQKAIKRSVPPKVEVVDPTEDLRADLQEHATDGLSTRPTPTVPAIEVAIDDSNKSYPFHYQFIADKLVLYGPFNSDLYEVIQINGTTQTAFLYYKGKYYHLDEKESSITPLIMIRDNMLLGKLDQYRNKN